MVKGSGNMPGCAGLTFRQSFVKRSMDIFVSFALLVTGWWIIFIAWILSSVDTKSNGLFLQTRVGRHGRYFTVIKIKTMKDDGVKTSITCSNDPRITRIGRLLRKSKIDELPQLWNVLIGDMSLVGPRPDVPGYADSLTGDQRVILEVRPGITGPATLKYRNEEELLAKQEDPDAYNREVIFPDKVRINMDYVCGWTMMEDLKCMWRTLVQ